jgi:DNA mismatch repair protein MutL
VSRIRILPERVANQIAAGEVVERPAAAVKELVENALDAGATRVEVEFRRGGAEFIRVEDDGHGMDRDDALLALQRHATSKIAEAADLDRLTTFGFRGEALPSIASVARFTLQTRAAGDEAGTEVTVNAGKILQVGACGRPVGTAIEVAHLFHAVPARRRFLRSEATESGHIVQIVRGYALAFPQVRFTLIQDGRTILRSPQCAGLIDRVGEILGRQLADALVAIDAAEAGWSLRGLIGRPGLERTGRQDLVLFVNARPVESRTLVHALLEGYRESLPKGRYPAAILFLAGDPAAVDVNVHPTKREIRFRDEAAVRDFVVRSVWQRLCEVGSAAARTVLTGPVAAGPRPRPPAPVSDGPARSVEPAPVAAGPVEPAGALPEPAVAEPAGAPAPAPAAGWRWLGLVQGAYALFETPAGLVLLDRQAARERVLFERLQAQFRDSRVTSQRLLLPVTVEVDPIAAALLTDGRAFLGAHGFDIAEFGRQCFRIEALPDWIDPAQAEAFLRDLLAALREGRIDERRLDLAREELARLAAARAARHRGEPLEPEVRRLVVELFATRLPLTSPGGRPTFVELNWNELSRRFQRS